MALPHGVSGESIDVRPLGPRLPTERTAALFKARDLEVIRLVLSAGKSVPPHRVPGDITIHCLEGSLRIDVDGAASLLNAGELLFLAGDVVHGVKAISDASALVTIALKP